MILVFLRSSHCDWARDSSCLLLFVFIIFASSSPSGCDSSLFTLFISNTCAICSYSQMLSNLSIELASCFHIFQNDDHSACRKFVDSQSAKILQFFQSVEIFQILKHSEIFNALNLRSHWIFFAEFALSYFFFANLFGNFHFFSPW